MGRGAQEYTPGTQAELDRHADGLRKDEPNRNRMEVLKWKVTNTFLDTYMYILTYLVLLIFSYTL